MANTLDTGSTSTSYAGVYRQEWEARLQDRLNKPQNWKEVCNVIYTTSQVVNVPYMSTVPSVTTGTRGTAYTFADFALTNQQLNITTKKMIPMYVDRGDLGQCDYVKQMEMADLQATLLNEAVEAAVLAAAASATNFGDNTTSLGLGSTAITVSATNIDDIVRGVRREITVANGTDLANRNGIFFIWRPADMELLEQFCQANGYQMADITLKDGIKAGFHALGADHYVSNSHTTGHVFAGVKKLMTVGILSTTYGKMTVTEDPGLLSGMGFVSRIDYGTLIPTNYLPVLFDINVN